MLLLVPADPLHPYRPDPHFAAEAEAATELGHAVAVVDHDALEAERAGEAVLRVPADHIAVYRGWMLTSPQYAAFSLAVAARGSRLRTTGSQYRAAHELPCWWAVLREHTPFACWTDGPDLAALRQCLAQVGAGGAVLRDYAKSAKHDWDAACYIPDVTDVAGAERVARRFLEVRGDAFSGGFVVRRFESFVGAEVRTWWVCGEPVLVTAHPDTPEAPVALEIDELEQLRGALSSLDLPFFTVDLTRHEDGRWRVVELGDGQVSDRPASAAPGDVIRALMVDSG